MAQAAIEGPAGKSGFNALFTMNDSTTAARFNNARYQNDVLRFSQYYPKATGVAAFYVNGNARVADSTYVDFLKPFVATTEAQSTSVDLKLSKSFEWQGKHQLTLGAT